MRGRGPARAARGRRAGVLTERSGARCRCAPGAGKAPSAAWRPGPRPSAAAGAAAARFGVNSPIAVAQRPARPVTPRQNQKKGSGFHPRGHAAGAAAPRRANTPDRPGPARRGTGGAKQARGRRAPLLAGRLAGSWLGTKRGWRVEYVRDPQLENSYAEISKGGPAWPRQRIPPRLKCARMKESLCPALARAPRPRAARHGARRTPRPRAARAPAPPAAGRRPPRAGAPAARARHAASGCTRSRRVSRGLSIVA